MKSFLMFFDRSYGYSRAIIAALVGIVLVIWPDAAVRTIVIVIGSIFLLLGAVTMIFSKKPEEEAAPTTKECPFCKPDIHIEAPRWPHCTSQL